jgi:hypothetical protein
MIADRMTTFMTVLQPLVEEADIAVAEHTASTRPYWTRLLKL